MKHDRSHRISDHCAVEFPVSWKVSMSGWLIILTGIISLDAYVAFDQAIKGNAQPTRMGIAYGGYAFSNIGLFLLATK
jgi:hypothetical protein